MRQAPQVVQDHGASSGKISPRSSLELFPFEESKDASISWRSDWTKVLGVYKIPLMAAGQTSSQRPQRTQASKESNCFEVNSVILPTPSSSVSSIFSIFSRMPGLRRERKITFIGVNIKWRSLVKGILAIRRSPKDAWVQNRYVCSVTAVSGEIPIQLKR